MQTPIPMQMLLASKSVEQQTLEALLRIETLIVELMRDTTVRLAEPPAGSIRPLDTPVSQSLKHQEQHHQGRSKRR